MFSDVFKGERKGALRANGLTKKLMEDKKFISIYYLTICNCECKHV